MKHLLIVGARGWGREVYDIAKRSLSYSNGDYDIKGFLDSKSDAFEGLRGDYPPILCAPEDYVVEADDVFIIAMGDNQWRRHYADIIESKGGKFISIISGKVLMNSTVEIGEGSIVTGYTSVSDNVTIGKHVIIHGFCTLGHDAVVKDYATLLSYVFLGGYVEVGEGSTMNPKSMIIPHKKIGKNVVVGASSVVIRNIKDGIHVLGNPAKKIEY